MIASFDATMLILLFDRDASGPRDKKTGKPVDYCQERISHLIETIAKTRGSRIVLPTPALAEFLVRVDPEKVSEYVSQIQRLRGSVIAPFDVRAAIDFADMQRSVIFERTRRIAKAEIESRAKAKFDQQIVAISKSMGANVIYSDDRGLASYAKRFDLEVIGVAELPQPPDTLQGVLPLEPPEATRRRETQAERTSDADDEK